MSGRGLSPAGPAQLQQKEEVMKMRKQTMIAVAAGLGLLLAPAMALAADEERGQLSRGDYKFLKDAATSGQMEVELGDLAKQKGMNQSVKTFGEKMVTDHSKANEELKAIASQKGVTLPAKLSHGERSDIEHLQKATGKDFDQDFASRMVKDHKKDVKDFEDAAKDLKDPELKAFAAKTLPTLQEHLRMAQEMESAVKNEK
jgi:putative membrane protein